MSEPMIITATDEIETWSVNGQTRTLTKGDTLTVPAGLKAERVDRPEWREPNGFINRMMAEAAHPRLLPETEMLHRSAMERYWKDAEFHARCETVFAALAVDPKIRQMVVYALALDDIVCSTHLLAEPIDPHVDKKRLGAYLRGEIEWEVLNSPEQAQVMDWRLR